MKCNVKQETIATNSCTMALCPAEDLFQNLKLSYGCPLLYNKFSYIILFICFSLVLVLFKGYTSCITGNSHDVVITGLNDTTICQLIHRWLGPIVGSCVHANRLFDCLAVVWQIASGTR